MIDVTLLEEKDSLVGYRVSGHAMFADYGLDIVCASVTTLAVGSLNTLTDVLNLSEEIDYHIEEGFMELRLNNEKLSAQALRDIQIVLRGMEVNLKSVSLSYPDSVCITYEEV